MLLEEEKIFKYLSGYSSKEEVLEVENWLPLSDSNKTKFEEIRQIHELSGFDKKSYNPDVDQAWSKVTGQLFPAKEVSMSPKENYANSFQWGAFYKIAAVLVLAVGISYFMVDLNSSNSFDLAYTTTSGELKELVLADGTKVSLNENSVFKYSDQFNGNERRVYLQGEAFFDVAKDRTKPFIVSSPNASTKVLGTSFNLRISEKEALLDVYSGKVAFGDLSKKDANIILVKGQRALFKNGQTSELRTYNPNVNAWRTGDLKFVSTPLSKVVMALEKLYKVEIEYTDSISKCLITSTFEDESLENVLSVVETIAQIKSTKKEGVIHLSGSGCR